MNASFFLDHALKFNIKFGSPVDLGWRFKPNFPVSAERMKPEKLFSTRTPLSALAVAMPSWHLVG